MTTAPRQTPDWFLEKLARGELAEEQRALLLRRLGEEGGLERLERLAESDRQTLARHPPGVVAQEIQRRVQRLQRVPEARPRRWGLLLLAVPAVAAVALLVVAPQPQGLPAGDEAEVTREKGLAPHLVVHCSRDGKVERLPAGAPARAREVVQLSYVGAGWKYGAIFSVDGRGSLTLHFPDSPGAAQTLAPRGEVPLAEAYELDDAPGFERFFFVTSDQPFDMELVLDAGRILARDPGGARRDPLPLPPGLGQTSFVIEKVQP